MPRSEQRSRATPNAALSSTTSSKTATPIAVVFVTATKSSDSAAAKSLPPTPLKMRSARTPTIGAYPSLTVAMAKNLTPASAWPPRTAPANSKHSSIPSTSHQSHANPALVKNQNRARKSPPRSPAFPRNPVMNLSPASRGVPVPDQPTPSNPNPSSPKRFANITKNPLVTPTTGSTATTNSESGTPTSRTAILPRPAGIGKSPARPQLAVTSSSRSQKRKATS